MQHDDPTPRYPIRAVARQTGLTPHVLRAWERRYGVVDPGRTAGGDRLYSPADVARFRLLGRLVAAGHAIGSIARLPLRELEALLPPERAGSTNPEAERLTDELLLAVLDLDATTVSQTLNRASAMLAGGDFIDGVVLPVLRAVGDLWERERICPAHEHMLSSRMSAALHRQMEALTPPAGAPEALAAAPAGQHHELGALVAAVVAAQEGWRVTYLGADLPAADIAAAARQRSAAVVMLGAALPDGTGALEREVAALRALVEPDTLILAGGGAAQEATAALRRSGAEYIGSMAELRARLRAGQRDAA